MADYQSMFRQFGQDVSDAILAPVEARLKALQLRKELDKDASASEALEEKTRLRATAAETLRKKFGDAYADLYLAGESASSLASLRRSDADRIKALREGKKAKGGDRYIEGFDIASKMTEQVNGILNSELRKVASAKASGSNEDAVKAMDRYKVLYDGLSSMLKNNVYSLDKDLRSTYAVDLAKSAETVLKDLNPDQIDVLDQVISGALSSSLKVDNDIIKELEDSKNEYGLDIDLSGIPSGSDISKFIWASVSNGEITPEIAKTIMSVKDQDDLKGIANDKSANPAARKLAASILKQQVAVDSIDPQIRKKLQELPYDELYEKSESTEEGVIAERIRGAAKKELKRRPRPLSKSRPFQYNPLVKSKTIKKLFGSE